jgi:SAM-dependent methyltransferase
MVVKNAWEVSTDEQALLALAGHDTPEEFQRDREQRAKEVLALCEVAPNSRGFEIGSGEGTVARLLSPHCLHLDCNDISESFLERARKNCAASSNVSFHTIGDAYLGHLPSGSYDFGFSLNVFIHFNSYDMYLYLVEVKRLLKPGARFLFDACTLGQATLALFHEQAKMYRQDPQQIRGLLSYTDPALVPQLIRASGLNLDGRSNFDRGGWLKVLVRA